jgi:hypothetical protein
MQRKLSIKAGKHFTTLLNVLYNPFPEVTLVTPVEISYMASNPLL